MKFLGHKPMEVVGVRKKKKWIINIFHLEKMFRNNMVTSEENNKKIVWLKEIEE